MTQVASCRSKNQEKYLIHCEAVRKRENHIIWNLDLMVVKKMGKKKKEINCLLACQSVKNLSSGFFFLSFFFFFLLFIRNCCCALYRDRAVVVAAAAAAPLDAKDSPRERKDKSG